MHYFVSSVTAILTFIITHAQFLIYINLYIYKEHCVKVLIGFYIESVIPTLSMVKIQFLDICPLYIAISVKSYTL